MKRFGKFFVLLISFLIVAIGFSNWIIVGEKVSKIGKNAVSSPVAYLSSDSSTLYTRIEKALKVANDLSSSVTVYVIPGVTTYILNDCIINSNVTLCLPYEGTTYDNRAGVNATFADDIDNSTDYLISNVVISKGVTLTNNGTIQVGGILGVQTSSSNPLQGQTSGNYCKITMEENSKIISNGTIDCRGYIKESSLNNNSYIDYLSGSVCYSPFVVYDYRGGTNTIGTYMYDDDGNDDGNICPFNVFDMPNIQVNQKYYAGSLLYGYVDIFTNAQTKGPYLSSYYISIGARHNTDILNIIGSSESVINLTKGFINIKYTPKLLGYTSNDTDDGFTVMDFYGEAFLGYFSIYLDIMGDISVTGGSSFMRSIIEGVVKNMLPDTTMTSQGIYFPVCWKYKINLNYDDTYGGSYEVNNKIKFLTGSNLTINDKATLNIGTSGKLIAYSSFVDTKKVNVVYPSKNQAEIVNNGTINVNGALAGITTTSSTTGSYSISSSATTTINDCKEGSGSFDISISNVLSPSGAITYTFTPITSVTDGIIVEVLRGFTRTSLTEYENLTETAYNAVNIEGNYVWESA